MMILKLQDHFPARVADWLVAGILTSWGLGCLYLAPETWNLPVYSGLREFASQLTWATFAIVIGLTRMAALFVNGAIRRSPHARLIGAAASIFLWTQLSFGMFASAASPLDVAIYPWLLAADVLNVYRAAQDARLSDTKARNTRGAQGNATGT